MVVVVLKAATSFAGIDYNERKNEEGKSELLVAENFAMNPDNLKKSDYIAYMESVCRTNPAVKAKQFHAVISCKGREYSAEDLKNVALQYINKMGYGNNPYMIYFHSDAEKQAVIDKAANINCEVKTKFNDLFNSWNEEISINPQTKYSSSTLAYTTLPQFKEMQAMGKNIIPLIMEKLLDEDNFFLLPLYDAIQTDSQLKISYKKGDAKILEGEQNKAKRTVRLWLSLSGN